MGQDKKCIITRLGTYILFVSMIWHNGPISPAYTHLTCLVQLTQITELQKIIDYRPFYNQWKLSLILNPRFKWVVDIHIKSKEQVSGNTLILAFTKSHRSHHWQTYMFQHLQGKSVGLIISVTLLCIITSCIKNQWIHCLWT